MINEKYTPAAFASEEDMQDWLRGELEDNDCMSDLIVNLDAFRALEIKDQNIVKIYEVFAYCLESLDMVNVLAENENISLNPKDILKPDFLLYAPETQSLVIVELKNLSGPSRNAGTEVAAYANELKSYVPFLSEGDTITLIISSVWPTLLLHYISHEIAFLGRKVLCLQPVETSEGKKLCIVDPAKLAAGNEFLKLSAEYLWGFQICLYDDELYRGGDRRRTDQYLQQMHAAIRAMATRGNALKNHGFAFLWKDTSNSLSPYNITVINIAAFYTLEKFFHNEDYEPGALMKKLIHEVIQEHDPMGDSQSIMSITDYGIEFFKNFCSPVREGFLRWKNLRNSMLQHSELISFHSWGFFEEQFYRRLLSEYNAGNTEIEHTDPFLALDFINGLIDPDYPFFDLNYYGWEEEDDDDLF